MQDTLSKRSRDCAGLPEPPVGLLTGASLFLDFDGTLVEIAARPDAIVVDPRLPVLLARLAAAFAGRVAIVSGRSVAELAHWLGSLDLALAGSHGVEIRWPDGRTEGPAPIDPAPLLAATDDVRARFPGVVVEAKPFGIALHYRNAPDAGDACRTLATALAAAHGLVVQPGKMVFELRQPGVDKGNAVRRLLSHPAMAGSKPVFVGDDLTDEAGFAAAAAFGGAGVLVGPDRPTAARYRLDTVAATLGWLSKALA